MEGIECARNEFSFPRTLLNRLAYYSPMAFMVSYYFFHSMGVSPLAFATLLIAVLILRTYLYPIILTPALTRHPDKETQLAEIAGDLMQRAETMRCPVMVADRFYDVDDKDEAENNEPDLNAFACGFRKSRRVVIYADLMDHYSGHAVRGVLAHELAHIHHHHTVKALILNTPPFALLLFLLRSGDSLELVYFAIGTLVLLAFMRKVSRVHEFQADRTAADWVGPEVMHELIDNFGTEPDVGRADRLMRTHPLHQQRKDALSN